MRAIMSEAEMEYGQRDQRFSICQVFFHSANSAKGRDASVSAEAPGSNRLIIFLADACRTHEVTRACLLAHECVHAMSYVPSGEINWLEEGVCEDFASLYVRRHFPQHKVPMAHPRYADAHVSVRRLIDRCPASIRALRAMEPSLSRVSVKLLTQVCPDCPTDFVETLLRKFSA
jgi:hypothetical protein